MGPMNQCQRNLQSSLRVISVQTIDYDQLQRRAFCLHDTSFARLRSFAFTIAWILYAACVWMSNIRFNSLHRVCFFLVLSSSSNWQFSFFLPFTWKCQEEYRTRLIIWQTHIRKSIVALKIGQKMPHYSKHTIVMDMANGMYYNDIQKCTLFLF